MIVLVPAGDMVEICKLYKEKCPNGPPFHLGPSLLRYTDLDFETQDHGKMFCRYSVFGADGCV